MSQDNIAYERELGNINIRGKRGKKTVPFGIKPVAAEVHKGKIDEGIAPAMNLDIDLPNIGVTAKDKSEPIKLEIPTVEQPAVDTNKITTQVPMHVPFPERLKKEDDARRTQYAEEMSNLIDKYIYVPQATQETISKAHSIYDIEKEKQAVRDKEKADANELGRLYVEGRRYGLDKLMEEVNAVPHVDKPIVDENVPIIDETLEKEETLPNSLATEKKEDEKKKSDLAFMDEYWKSLYSDADREADEKRKKAAKWITAAQMLGDSIGALSNVYWTGKGANAMKFEPGAQKAAAATYQLEQDIRNAREKAAKAKMDATLKKYEMEMEKNKADRAQADSDRKHEETVRHNKAVEEISRLGAENAANSHKVAMYNAETSRLNAGTAARNAAVNEAEERRKAEQYNKQHGDRKFLIGDQWVNIPKDKWEGVVGSIYNSLPEEVRKVYETQVTDELGIKKETRKAPTIAIMDAAVRQYAQDPAVMEAILKAAGQKVEAANTEAPKNAVVKDAHGNEYSVNPDIPVLGAAPSFMQTDEAKKHLNGIVISTGKKPVWQ